MRECRECRAKYTEGVQKIFFDYYFENINQGDCYRKMLDSDSNGLYKEAFLQ